MSCGSSSSDVALMNRPTGPSRGSSADRPRRRRLVRALGSSGRSERNLSRVNCRPSSPTRTWRKRTEATRPPSAPPQPPRPARAPGAGGPTPATVASKTRLSAPLTALGLRVPDPHDRDAPEVVDVAPSAAGARRDEARRRSRSPAGGRCGRPPRPPCSPLESRGPLGIRVAVIDRDDHLGHRPAPDHGLDGVVPAEERHREVAPAAGAVPTMPSGARPCSGRAAAAAATWRPVSPPPSTSVGWAK